MKTLLPILFLAGLALAGCSTTSPQHISVRGNQFITERGKPIVFRGLASSDPASLHQRGHWNAAYFDAAKSWNANSIRFAVHPAHWRKTGPTNYLHLLDQGVQWAAERNLYVVIDWHSMGNLPRGKFWLQPNETPETCGYTTTREETFAFWRTIAQRYGTNRTVAFYELFNEPVNCCGLGDCSWEEWKTLLEELIAEIRAHGGEGIPLVAGFNWAYDLKPVADAPLNATNIAYVSHPYPMKVKPPWEAKWTSDWGFVAEKYPLVLSEIGFVPPGEPGGHDPVIGDETYGEALTRYCRERGISYFAWCFDPVWPPSLLKDWNYTPTRQGEFWRKAMQDANSDPANR